MDCMKSIEEEFSSTLLKNMVSEIDVCSILNINENECVEKQKVNIEMIQHIEKSKKTKKSKRPKEEKYTKKTRKVVNNPQKRIGWKNKQNLNISW